MKPTSTNVLQIGFNFLMRVNFLSDSIFNIAAI